MIGESERRVGWVGRLRPLAALLLVLGLGVGAVHHHAQNEPSHSCPVCSLSHAPAVTTPVTTGSSPSLRVADVVLVPACAPVATRTSSVSSRAPPSL